MVAWSVKELPRDKGREKTGKEGTSRDYDRTLRIVTPSPLIGAATVLASPLVPPKLYPYITSYESDLGALLRERVPSRLESAGNIWDVQLFYSSEGPRPELAEQDPLLRPPDIAWSVEKYAVALQEWFKEDPPGSGTFVADAVTTSAGEAFDPPIERQYSRLVLTYGRNVALHDQITHLDIIDTVNETEWYGFPARTARVDDYKVDAGHENNTAFWRESWVFKIDARGWDLRILDAGYFELVSGVRKLILDSAGRPYQTPQLLDGTGLKLAVGADPVYLERRYLDSREFNALGIPA